MHIQPDLSIVVVTFNTAQVTFNCIKSIFETQPQINFEVILVDNGSIDNTLNLIKESFPLVKLVVLEKNYGFSFANNRGIDISIANHILLLNSDTLILKDSIENLYFSAVNNNYEIVAPILLNSDFSVQRSWFNFPSTIKIFFRITNLYLLFYSASDSWLFKTFTLSKKPAFMVKNITVDTVMDYLSFACILINRDVINKIGNLDENLFFYHEDCEYGIRAHKNNYRLLYAVNSKVIHLGGTSSNNSSIQSFENDIYGLLYVYKIHYSTFSLRKLKVSLYLALLWRIFFWNFGYYRQLEKIGLYSFNDLGIINYDDRQLLEKYKELLKVVSNY